MEIRIGAFTCPLCLKRLDEHSLALDPASAEGVLFAKCPLKKEEPCAAIHSSG